MSFYCFFFFKQKTAYEMRISDWSSDVCSSDLVSEPLAGHARGKCDTKGFRQAADTQLDHQIGAMDFYRARRNAEIKSDGFVRQALGQALEDVLLARIESRDEDSRIGRPAWPAFGLGKALQGGFTGRYPGRAKRKEAA